MFHLHSHSFFLCWYLDWMQIEQCKWNLSLCGSLCFNLMQPRSHKNIQPAPQLTFYLFLYYRFSKATPTQLTLPSQFYPNPRWRVTSGFVLLPGKQELHCALRCMDVRHQVGEIPVDLHVYTHTRISSIFHLYQLYVPYVILIIFWNTEPFQMQ